MEYEYAIWKRDGANPDRMLVRATFRDFKEKTASQGWSSERMKTEFDSWVHSGSNPHAMIVEEGARRLGRPRSKTSTRIAGGTKCE